MGWRRKPDVEGRQAAEDFDRRWIDSDFFIGFTNRRLLERFAFVDAAARQRHLAGMVTKA